MAFPSKERAADDRLLGEQQRDEIWEGEAEAFWKVDGGPRLTFPVSRIHVTGGMRVQKRDRPGRNGTRITTTGAKAREYNVVIPLDGSIVGTYELPLYPDLLNALVDSADREETGTLFLPMRGIKRCKAGDWDFAENGDGERSATILNMNWCEDNEEVVTASSFTRASVRSQGRRLSDQATFTMQRDAVWDGSLADMNDLVSELEGIVSLPQTTAQDISTRSRIIRHAAERAVRAFETGADEGSRLLVDPLNSATIRKLVEIQDLSARAEAESFAGKPKTMSFLVTFPRTLQSVAVELRQDYLELLKLNQYGIEDPMALEDGDVVRVFEVTA